MNITSYEKGGFLISLKKMILKMGVIRCDWLTMNYKGLINALVCFFKCFSLYNMIFHFLLVTEP